MNMKGLCLIAFLMIACLFCAGCGEQTGIEPIDVTYVATQATQAQTGSGFSLATEPTQVIPTVKYVEVTAKKDPIYGDTTVVFNGGKGQAMVTDIDVTAYLSSGKIVTSSMDVKAGEELLLKVEDGEATKGDDRIVVFVTFTDGTRYRVYDSLVLYKAND